MNKTNLAIAQLYFGKEEIKPELRMSGRAYESYVRQDPNGILTADYYKVCKGNYSAGAEDTLVRVYDGLNKDTAQKIMKKVWGRTHHLIYDELRIFPKDTLIHLSKEERFEASKRLDEYKDFFEDLARKQIKQLDLELLVIGALGKKLIPGKIDDNTVVRNIWEGRDYPERKWDIEDFE